MTKFNLLLVITQAFKYKKISQEKQVFHLAPLTPAHNFSLFSDKFSNM